MRPHETIQGRILYTSRKADRLGQERGREFFTITKHQDGRRTLRAQAEIDDAPNVLRDVVLTQDLEGLTRDAFVRLSVGDQTFGSSWFRFTDEFAECEGWNHDRGRFSERIEFDHVPPVFGTHPIQGDAWHLRAVDRSKGPCIQVFEKFLMSSLDHRGATGPSLVWHDAGMKIEYVGEDRITVGAGTFDALHFCYGDRESKRPGSNESGEHPPYEIWVTADDDFILLKAQVTGYMMTYYELMELRRHSADSR
jgi:hypothetical protein